MRQLWAIVGRETGAFFKSPMGPMVLTGFLVAVGLFFTIFLYGYSDMSLAALQSPRSGNYMNLAEGLFRPMVSNTIFFLMFLMPAVCMRLFAPEAIVISGILSPAADLMRAVLEEDMQRAEFHRAPVPDLRISGDGNAMSARGAALMAASRWGHPVAELRA